MQIVVRKQKHILFALSLIVIGKITGFGKDLLLSFYHGASKVTDAYFIANSIASVSYIALYMAIPVIVVPYFSKLIKEAGNGVESFKLFPMLFSFVAMSLALSIGLYAGAEVGVELLFPGLEAETKNYALEFIKIISLTFVFSTIVAVLNAVQVLKGRKVNSLFVPVVNNSAFIIAIIVFSNIEDFKYVVWAGFCAWVFLAAVNFYFSKQIASISYMPGFPIFDDRKLLLVFLSALMVFYVEQLNSYISVFFASGVGSSSVSFLSYANKLNLLMVSVFVVFLNVYAFPKLSAKRYEQDEEMSSFLIIIIKSIAVLCFPLVLLLCVHAESVISMIFERGLFSRHDVIVVSSTFQVLVLSLPLILIRDLLNRAVFAHENPQLSLIALMVSVVLHAVFVNYYVATYGLQGIAMGVVVSAFVNSIILVVFLRWFFNIKLVTESLKTIAICMSLLIGVHLLTTLVSSYVGMAWWVESIILLVSYFCCLYQFKGQQLYIFVKWLAFK